MRASRVADSSSIQLGHFLQGLCTSIGIYHKAGRHGFGCDSTGNLIHITVYPYQRIAAIGANRKEGNRQCDTREIDWLQFCSYASQYRNVHENQKNNRYHVNKNEGFSTEVGKTGSVE